MPELLTPYSLGRELGRGAFGVVHSGTHEPFGAVAIKVIDRKEAAAWLDLEDWETLYRTLVAEGESLQRAAHENVVRVHGVGHDESKTSLFIVTELCDRSVAAAIANGPLPLHAANAAIRGALRGLEFLHMQDMLHRDLKPANMLFSGEVTKLSDFGLVANKLIYGYASRAGYTPHLAPEVFEDRQTSKRSDVWAMGLTMFRILNGEPWYAEEQERLGLLDPAVAEARVVQGGFAQSLRWMPHVPDSWRRFVRAALHDSPTERPADGGALLTKFGRTCTLDVPSWRCDLHTAEAIEWTAPSKTAGRLVRVRWERRPVRGQRFFARTTNENGGAEKILKRSDEDLASVAALDQLDSFFGERIK